MKNPKRWCVVYLGALLFAGGAPLAYLAFVPASLDKKIGIGLRTLSFRHEERRVEQAAELVAQGKDLEAEELLRRYLDSRHTVGRGTTATDAVCDALVLLAELYEKRGKLKEALTCRERLVELSPNDFYYMYLLANSYDDAGDVDNALTYYRRSFHLEPAYPELQDRYFSRLGVGQLSKTEELVSAYEYYLELERRTPPGINVRYSAAPSDLEKRALEWLGLPLMAPDVDDIDVALGQGRSLVIPLAPAAPLLAARRDVMLWGEIYRMVDDLAWDGVELVDRDGRSSPVPSERLALEREGPSLQYRFSIVLAGYDGEPSEVRVRFERKPHEMETRLKRVVVSAYRDEAREVPPEFADVAAGRT